MNDAAPTARPRISLIATVLNEGESIRPLLDSIARQTLPPDEIVIVDGGSRDHTVEILRDSADRLPLRVIVEPGSNISAGRNRAIREARGDVIAVTDAGVVLADDWLVQIVAPLLESQTVDVVGGFFHAEAHTVFEAALGATTLPLAGEIDPQTFLPSSRSIAFRRSAWETAGGYPEWLDYCEDLVFDLRLKARVRPFAFAPRAIAFFRPRRSLNAFYRQYYRYARGDGKADLWRKRHAARYLTYGLAGPLLVLLGLRGFRPAWLLLAIGGALYLRRPYQRLQVVLLSAAQRGHVRVTLWTNLQAIALVPLIRITGDVAKMLGYPAGLAWRRANRPPNWRDDQRVL
jgi:glycosyltransferase involved in cell wall biosynthesis